jgi:hypothetical protein
MNSPITKSCICSVFEKQIVRRTNRLIRVRKLIGFVANFAQEVVKEQWPLSAGGLGGQGVEQFGRSKALVSLLNHQLSFPDHVHEFYTY